MKIIKKLVDQINEEICDAQMYAEDAIEKKAFGDMGMYQKYIQMSQDELKHAMYLHDYAVSVINSISEVYKATQEMQEKWDASHREYVDKVAWIKQMQQM